MDKSCQYCNKIFSSISNLKTHLKSSKKCILTRTTNDEINRNLNNNTIQTETYKCHHCNKSFSQKIHLATHLNTCKLKEINILKEQVKSKDEMIQNLQQKIDNQLKSKDEIIQSLQQKLDEKIKIIEEAFLKQTEKLSSSNTTNNTTNNTNNNNTINNYNVQFDKMVEKLVIFSPENIKNSINKINGYDLVYLNDFDGEKNFSSEFVKCIKNLTFCTDTSRGSLIVKKEDGNPDKITSESFVLKCLEDGKQECLQKINNGIQFLHQEYETGEEDPANATITVEDFAKCRYKLIALRDHIRQNGPNEVVTSLSNTLVKTVDQLSTKTNKKQQKKLK